MGLMTRKIINVSKKERKKEEKKNIPGPKRLVWAPLLLTKPSAPCVVYCGGVRVACRSSVTWRRMWWWASFVVVVVVVDRERGDAVTVTVTPTYDVAIFA